VTARLIELADTDDARRQAWDVVHPSERAVRDIFAGEKNASPTFDHRDGAITEFHRAGDMGVELDEDFPRPRHVVCGTCVKGPPIMVVPLR
jgi:hypothetical protein